MGKIHKKNDEQVNPYLKDAIAEEINSGAIIPTPLSDVYFVDANTKKGLRKFIAIAKKNASSSFSDYDDSVSEDSSGDIQSYDLSQDVDEANEVASTEYLLSFLGDQPLSHPHYRQAIIEIEVCDLTLNQEESLLPILLNFIEEKRNSNDPDDLIAVGSAIRKYIAIMPVGDIKTVSRLLSPGNRFSMPLEIELELVKMIFRKYCANPPEESDPCPELSCQVYNLAEAYLNPHVLPKGKHAAVAMNALQALSVMCSKYAGEAVGKATLLPFLWFVRQFEYRIRSVYEEWRKRLGDDNFGVRFIKRLLEDAFGVRSEG